MTDFVAPLGDSFPLPELSKALGIGERQIIKLADEGTLPREGRGKYPFGPCVRAYVEYLRGHSRNTKVAGIDLNAEKARKTKAEADIAEIEAAKTKGEIVLLSQVERALQIIFAEVKANLRNVPSRAVGQIVGDTSEHRIKDIILAEIDLALERLAEGIDFNETFDEDEDGETEV
jgi:phage terminase Nu1 subunit (DNA packaging protein)